MIRVKIQPRTDDVPTCSINAYFEMTATPQIYQAIIQIFQFLGLLIAPPRAVQFLKLLECTCKAHGQANKGDLNFNINLLVGFKIIDFSCP